MGLCWICRFDILNPTNPNAAPLLDVDRNRYHPRYFRFEIDLSLYSLKYSVLGESVLVNIPRPRWVFTRVSFDVIQSIPLILIPTWTYNTVPSKSLSKVNWGRADKKIHVGVKYEHR